MLHPEFVDYLVKKVKEVNELDLWGFHGLLDTNLAKKVSGMDVVFGKTY